MIPLWFEKHCKLMYRAVAKLACYRSYQKEN